MQNRCYMHCSHHIPVLLKAVIEGLNVKSDGIYVDCTIGAGGHSVVLLEKLDDRGLLIGIDKDMNAIKIAGERLNKISNRYKLFQESYAKLADILSTLHIKTVDGILFDLGVSSMQLDIPERGFAFRYDAPLDMRMNQNSSVQTAADLINSLSEDELAKCFSEYGEERYARRIARAIVEARQLKRITTTSELVNIIEKVAGRQSKIHPATRVFQALRIKVNSELAELNQALDQAFPILKHGGRLVVISYHSIEDRTVKRKFLEHIGRNVSLQEGGSKWQGTMPRGRLINKKPILPDENEIKSNPRSRSAKMRIFERIK